MAVTIHPNTIYLANGRGEIIYADELLLSNFIGEFRYPRFLKLALKFLGFFK